MQGVSKEKEILIQNELYKEVMLLIESYYHLEGIIDIEKKDSTKIVFTAKEEAIRKVAESIERFAQENELTINQVKECLIGVIQSKIELKDKFEEEFKTAKDVILSEDENVRET